VLPRDRDEQEHEIEIEGEEDASAAERAGRHEERTSRASRKELESEVQSLAEELDKVSAELEETKDQFLRGLADFDNYRKRIAREREQLTKCANEELIKKLLEVLDNIERALEAASGSDDFAGFKKGIELIYEHMKGILTSEGLCHIQCLGEDFDPNYHEAVMAIESEEADSDKVVEEIQKGYTIDGRVIRPSKVVVSK
jgi:molecular chaperone GrpE